MVSLLCRHQHANLHRCQPRRYGTTSHRFRTRQDQHNSSNIISCFLAMQAPTSHPTPVPTTPVWLNLSQSFGPGNTDIKHPNMICSPCCAGTNDTSHAGANHAGMAELLLDQARSHKSLPTSLSAIFAVQAPTSKPTPAPTTPVCRASCCL